MARRVAVTLIVAAALASGLASAGSAAPTWSYRTVSVQGRYRAVVGDFDGTGRDSILWYAPGPAADAIWFGRAGARDAASPFLIRSIRVDGRYSSVVVGNFAGDGRDDILWYRSDTGAAYLWTNHGPGQFTSERRNAPVGAQPLVLRDGAGKFDDVLWYHPDGRAELWHAVDDGSGLGIASGFSVPPGGRPVAGDFDGDGYGDAFVHVPGPGEDRALYVSSDGHHVRSKAFAVAGSYRPVAIPERTRDGILWWGDGAAPDAYWRSGPGETFRNVPTPTVRASGHVTPLPVGQAVISGASTAESRFVALADGGVFTGLGGHEMADQHVLVGDFDQDRGLDLFWYGPGSVPDEIWYGPPG